MRIYKATLNTLRGFGAAFRLEPALRAEAMLLLAAFPVAALIAPSAGWYVAMIGALIAALMVELVNTAIEKLADRVTLDHDRRIGMVKDLGSAAVFCALCLAGLVWFGALSVRFGWM